MNTNTEVRESKKDSLFTIGEYIRIKRRNLNMSLEELAKKIFISKSTLSKIENGKIKFPKPVYVFRLSKILCIEYELLLKLQGYDIEYIRYRDKLEKYN